MPRPSFFPRRSLREWAIRISLAMAALAVGSFSISHTIAQVLVKNDSVLAHALAPWDGRITAALAASLAGPEATPADRRRGDALARQALRQDPTTVAAASTLGVNAQIRGDGETASRLFVYSEKLSRRDLQTQLWKIEEAVTRNDIRGALHHYDIALRAKGQSWALLFPILASASADAQVRGALVQTLTSKPLWTEYFVYNVASNPPDPKTASLLFLDLRRAGVPVSHAAHASAINALLGGGFAEEAWNHYATIRRGVDRRRSRDPRFVGAGENPTAFDWSPVNDGGVSGSIQRDNSGGVFDFSVPATIGGPLLQQLQMLPPGRYRITGHGNGIEQAAGSRPYWVLICRSDGRELARVTMPNSSVAGGKFDGQMVVPTGCPLQVLMLAARASDAVSGLAGQIDTVQLAPAQ